ncbi:TonB family protein [Variovorax sp. LT1R16]|uniref:TonB family protein n=1 Tax=Variovorax sp. LT1R16 TaxID=3443728 RepID=UPI003F47A76A
MRLRVYHLKRCAIGVGVLGACSLAAVHAAESAATAMRAIAASGASPGVQREELQFDIPAQPLADALSRYAVASRRTTLFPSVSVAGRTSSALRGLYSPEMALRKLLEGTGLVAEKTPGGPSDAFVLRAVGPSASMTDTVPLAAVDDDDGYDGLVQTRIWRALCANPRTAPGGYRSILRFEVNAEGAVHRVRLLRTTGDPRRDALLLDIVQRVRIDAPPPAGMAQPLTMVVLPRSAKAAPYCGSGSSEHG